MLNDYIKLGTLRSVPYTHDRYSVTKTGEILDLNSNQYVDVENGLVELDILGRIQKVSVGWVVSITYRPMFEAGQFILNWTVSLRDPKKSPTDIQNLIWHPPLGGQPCPEKSGFYVIPGHSEHAIDRNGTLYNRKLGTERPSIRKPDRNGYVGCSVKLDTGGSETTHIHRCLALAFIPYAGDLGRLTVNHRDGDKLNNRVENLEWMTYKENNAHARASGLWNSYRPMTLKDHWTGEIIEFPHITACAEFLNVSSGLVSEYCKAASDKLYRKRYTFRLLNPHPTFDTSIVVAKAKADALRIRNHECAAYNVHTRQLFVFPDRRSLCKALGLNKESVRTALNSKLCWPRNGYVFSYAHQGKFLTPNFPQEMLRDLGNRSDFINVFKLDDGSIRYVFSYIELADALSMDLMQVKSKLAYKPTFTHNGVNVTQIKWLKSEPCPF